MASKPLAGMDVPDEPAPFPSPPWDPPPPYPELRFDGAELRFFFCCCAQDRIGMAKRAGETPRAGDKAKGRCFMIWPKL